MKKKWTIIDTIIVLIIAAAAVIGCMKLMPSLGSNDEKSTVEFTVLIQNKEQALADAITPGAKATLSLTEKDGGIIKDVRSEVSKQMTFNSIDGTYENVEADSKVDIYVTVEAECSITDKYIKTGDTAIKVGAEIPVRGQGFATSGFVIEIND
ncbi:MAG: DUF4330 domain-containing protein [bacterium]|nr:DUF4330 domain-containing protein [bacterium]